MDFRTGCLVYCTSTARPGRGRVFDYSIVGIVDVIRVRMLAAGATSKTSEMPLATTLLAM
jgi:hypothetical protein